MSDSSDPKPKPVAKSRLKRLLQNLGIAAFSFFFCLGLFEIALRVAGYGNLEIYEPDEKLYWRLKPNQDCYTKVDHKPVHINSHGTRGPEFNPAKPPRTYRVLSLGDSRTFGWGLTDEETYSRRLEQLLKSRIGQNQTVEVINAGVNAWSYPQMLVFYRDFAAAWQPDCVILAEANLWTQFSEKNSPDFVKSFLWRVRLKNFLRRFAIYHFVVEVQLRSFYEKNRSKFIPVDPQQDPLFKEQQQSDPDAVFRTAIEGVCTTARSNQAQVLLVFIPTGENFQITNESRGLTIKRTVAEKLGVPLVDLTPAIAPEGKALYLDADPVHLNARGNEITANRIFETLTNRLAK
jgi:lysophospholipase L1-like esterase